MGVRISLLLLAVIFVRSVFADELTRAVQEQLQGQKVYSGPIDGERSEMFTKALKTYQQQHGLPATGVIDRATAKALDDENGTALPDARPSASVALRLSPPPQASPPLATASPSEPRETPRVTPEVSVPPTVPIVSPTMAPEATIAPSIPATTATPAAESSPTIPATPTPSPPAVSDVSSPPPPQESPELPPPFSVARVTKFLRDFLHAGEGKYVTPQLRYFSFPVDYFEHGPVKQQFVRSDTLRYMRRWPRRRYSLSAPVRVAPVDANSVTADFTVSYAVQSGKRRTSGRSSNRVTLREIGGKLKIVAIKEEPTHD